MSKPKRKWPRITAMVVVAVVLVGSVALILVDKFAAEQRYIPQSIVSLPSRVVSMVLKPFQGAFAWASSGVADYLESWKLRKTIEIEYNKLKMQNDELIYASMYNAELEEENERLRALLGTYDDYMTQFPVVATVIGKETGNWYQMFTIDKGKNDDIEVNMAVINAEGLIGYVYEVNDTSSEVVSIIDKRAGVAGTVQSTRDQGSIRGTLGVDDEPTCRMYYLPVDFIPRPGDTVVTSGIGQPFPKGIPIGTVRESSRYLEDNKQYVVIEPYVKFDHLEEVIVLVYIPAEEEMPAANDGQVSYIPVPMDTPRVFGGVGEEIENPYLGGVTPPPRVTREPLPGIDLGGGEATAPPEGYEDDENLEDIDPDATPSPSPFPTPLPPIENDDDFQGEGVG